MFYNIQFTSIDFGPEGLISTEKVRLMSNMFALCRAVTELDLSGWDISKVTNMNQMFANYTPLTTIYAGDWCVTNPGISGGRMFFSCTSHPQYDGINYGFDRAHTGEGGYFTAK